MLSYVLLIVITLSIAAGIYALLKLYAPSDEIIKCPEEISILIKDYTCNDGIPGDQKNLTLTIENKGFFNVSGFFLRLSNETNSAPTKILLGNLPITITKDYFTQGRYYFYKPLRPGKTLKTEIINYTEINRLTTIEIQPFITTKSDLVACERVNTISVRTDDCGN